MAAVVRAERNLVHQSRPPDANISTAITPTNPAASAICMAGPWATPRELWGDPPGHQHLPADAVELGGLDHRPRPGLARAAHDERRQLEVDRHVRLDHQGQVETERPFAHRYRSPRLAATGHTPLPS